MGRFCLACKSRPTLLQYQDVNNAYTRSISGLTKSDINKLLSFSENPEKYSTGTIKAREKVEYLESIKDEFSDGQLTTYTRAHVKYTNALDRKIVASKSKKTNYAAILAEAFNDQKSIKIRYKGSWRTIDPYSLNKTYVVAYCHIAHDIRTFRVDRVQGVELAEPFTFNESLGITAQSKLVDAPNYRGGGYRRGY